LPKKNKAKPVLQIKGYTAESIKSLIKKEYGIEYKKAQIYNIIKGLGFSYQKGKGIFPEANKEKQENFKST